MIKLEKISKYYMNNDKMNLGLLNVSLTLPNKGFILLKGKSGSGKSTLVNILSGIERIDSGKIYLDDVKLKNDEDKKILFSNVSVVNQDYKLFDNLTVFDNLMIVLNKNESSEVNKNKIEKILDIINLSDSINCKVENLSGGEKQRVAIGRSLLSNAKIILADEPTANLDFGNTMEIINLLKQISKDHLIIVSTHDVENINSYADYEIELENGQVARTTLDSLSTEETILTKKESFIHFRYLIKALGLIKKSLLTNLISTVFLGLMILMVFFISNFKSSNYLYTIEKEAIESDILVNTDPSRIIINDYDTFKDNPYVLKLLNNNVSFSSDLFLDELYSFNDVFKIEDYKDISAHFQITNILTQDYEIIKGQKPINNNDILIFVDEDNDEMNTLYDLYNSKLETVIDDNIYNVCGIANIKEENVKKNLKIPYPIIYSSDFTNELIYSLNRKAFVNYVYSMHNDKFVDIGIDVNSDIAINKIEFGYILDENLYFRGSELNLANYEITTSLKTDNYVSISEATLQELILSINNSKSIFLHDVNDKQAVLKELKSLGISAYSPYDNLINIEFNSEKNISFRIYLCTYVAVSITLAIAYKLLRGRLNKKTWRNRSIVLMLGTSTKRINILHILSMSLDIIYHGIFFLLFYLIIAHYNSSIPLICYISILLILVSNLLDILTLSKVSKQNSSEILSDGSAL